MTPEQEAEQLIESFKPHADWSNEYGSSEVQANFKHAKQCALIAIQKVIDELQYLGLAGIKDRYDHYEKVKKIIQSK